MTNRNSELDLWAYMVDITEVVGCRGTSYACPDISAVDRHIVRLYRQIEDTGPGPAELVQELWADIDLLLERRVFLQLDLQARDSA